MRVGVGVGVGVQVRVFVGQDKAHGDIEPDDDEVRVCMHTYVFG